MKIFRKVKSALQRSVKIVIIPQAPFNPRGFEFSFDFLLICLALWSGLTLWAGYSAGRQIDYWVTKADNKIIAAKMTYMASEMDKSREMLEMVRSTDKQLRSLLTLSSRQEILETDMPIGGPTAADSMNVKQMIQGPASQISQTILGRRMASLRKATAKRLASFQEIAWYISNQRSLYKSTPNMWPTEGRITSLFGYRFAPIERTDGEMGEFHPGIDIANNPDTLIMATADGSVRYAGWSHGYGQMILVDHGSGMTTLYGHTSKSLVKVGERVARGQVVAYMGTTGRSTGAHLHYEVWKNGRPINPMSYLKVRVTESLASEAAASQQNWEAALPRDSARSPDQSRVN